MLNSNFVFVGTAVASFGSLIYLIQVLKGRVRPNRVSFFLWAINPLIIYFAQITQGVSWQSSLLVLAQAVSPFLVLLASFFNKKSEWKLTKRDLSLGFLSIIGLLLWYVTKVGDIAIFFSIFADCLAALPTIIKSYQYPDTEIAWPWLAGSIGVIFTLLTFDRMTFTNSAFIIYFFITNFTIFFLVQFRIGKRIKLKGLFK